MKTLLVDGMKSELPGLPDWPDQVMVVNRRGVTVAAGSSEDEARKNAAARIAGERRRNAADRAWRRTHDENWFFGS